MPLNENRLTLDSIDKALRCGLITYRWCLAFRLIQQTATTFGDLRGAAETLGEFRNVGLC
ncbi:hypothetical protein RSSM_04073 [Rhodopirellula sallentina SM41]|uniref:Uncharacterized protein n=1 Tax=Rhodopirellula sallentina SM41 TaxID=1263870 RepID=M5UEP7_9BACT|nr:hypothetical protein RSSM_04073 [Rhodopirellula sallentina SM41]